MLADCAWGVIGGAPAGPPSAGPFTSAALPSEAPLMDMAPPVVMAPPLSKALGLALVLLGVVVLLVVVLWPEGVLPILFAVVLLVDAWLPETPVAPDVVVVELGLVPMVVPPEATPFPVGPLRPAALISGMVRSEGGEVMSNAPPTAFVPSPGVTAPAVAAGGARWPTLTTMLPNCSGSLSRPSVSMGN